MSYRLGIAFLALGLNLAGRIALAADEESRVKQIEMKALEETRPLAEKAMATMLALARGGGYKILGFASAEEAAAARLDSGIPIFNVDNASLVKYNEGVASFYKLLTVCDVVVYPLSVSNEVKSSISVRRISADHWEAGRFGAVPAADLDSALDSVSGSSGGHVSFLVSVPTQQEYVKGNFGPGGGVGSLIKVRIGEESVADAAKAKAASEARSQIFAQATAKGMTEAAADATAKSATQEMVWAEQGSKLYHLNSELHFAEGKAGKFMTEGDALDAGFKRASDVNDEAGAGLLQHLTETARKSGGGLR